jgi:hypothetical protein
MVFQTITIRSIVMQPMFVGILMSYYDEHASSSYLEQKMPEPHGDEGLLANSNDDST